VNEVIRNMAGYVQKRRSKGMTATQIRDDLMDRGYDLHAAQALVMLYWHAEED
jgi:hypothetical protein